MATPNKTARKFVESLLPFKGSNLSGVIEEQGTKKYVVYSYKWYPLFIYEFETMRWYENHDRYSVSTSRQQNQCRPCVPIKAISHNEMKAMLKR